jgi:hypothetical protein
MACFKFGTIEGTVLFTALAEDVLLIFGVKEFSQLQFVFRQLL